MQNGETTVGITVDDVRDHVGDVVCGLPVETIPVTAIAVVIACNDMADALRSVEREKSTAKRTP